MGKKKPEGEKLNAGAPDAAKPLDEAKKSAVDAVEVTNYLQSLIDSPKKYDDFMPVLKVLADRIRYSLFRRLRRYSDAFDLDINIKEITCDYLDVCAKDLEHDTLVYRVHSLICDQPSIVIFDDESVDFIINFVLAASDTSGGRPDAKKGKSPLTHLGSKLIDRVMQDFCDSIEDAFAAAMHIDLTFEKVMPPIPLNHDRHFMVKIVFDRGSVSLVMPFFLVEPICNAFQANFSVTEDFEAYSKALICAIEARKKGDGEEVGGLTTQHRGSGKGSESTVGASEHYQDSDAQYKKLLDGTEVVLRAELGPRAVPIRYLRTLKVGDMIIFNSDKSINLSTKEAVIFNGKIGYAGNSTAVKIDSIVNRKKT